MIRVRVRVVLGSSACNHMIGVRVRTNVGGSACIHMIRVRVTCPRYLALGLGFT